MAVARGQDDVTLIANELAAAADLPGAFNLDDDGVDYDALYG